MNVLLIPEDFRNDQYLLEPLFAALFRALGRPNARVRVCRDPLLGGVTEALDVKRLDEVVVRYKGMVDLFIVCVDRDGNSGRRARLDGIERAFRESCVLMAENAWEELETWTLAGLDLPADWRWTDIRAEVSVKERYFAVLARQRGLADAPGGGRRPLGIEAARRVNVIRQKCPEDFGTLASRIGDILTPKTATAATRR